MSLQQSNINKFPKHLQHVRLQKEEDEEQWISGEELCTEGSSDEENTNDIKKKFKSKPSHLPTISKEALHIKKSTASTSVSSASAKDSDDENTDNTSSSLKSPTQWRPKRGSIKLPHIDENPLDIETEKWKIEMKYDEALKELKSYKNKLNLNIVIDNDEEIDENDALTLENDLEKITHIFKECKEERMKIQKKVCKAIREFCNTPDEVKNTRKFHEIFNYKSDNENTPRKNNLKPTFKSKHKPLSKKNSKNTFHRHKKMTDLLNENEKARLKFLLSDIEIKEIDVDDKNNDKDKDNTKGKIINNKDNTKGKIINNKDNKKEEIINVDDLKNDNGFKPTDNESNNLNEIEQKLKTLQEMCDDADLKGNLSEDIYSIDEENREWKAYLKLTEERFRRINNKINKLHEQDEPKEKEDTADKLQET